MKTIMRNLTSTLLVAAAALETGRTQSASRELSLTDIRAQSPQETIFASALCQRALEDTGEGPGPFTHTQKGWIIQPYNVGPKTFVQDLNTLMEMSDEVILAGLSGGAVVLSPSGQSVTTYDEVKVIRGWKGPHHTGDVLVFGMPFGSLPCETSSPGIFTRRFDVDPVDYGIPPSFGLPETDSFAYLLFLRQSKGNETTLIQGLRPTAGEGLQGIFLIPVHVPVPPGVFVDDYCLGLSGINLKHCDAIIQSSQSPVVVPYARDPLAKKYSGKPVSQFLQEVQSVAAAQPLPEKASSK